MRAREKTRQAEEEAKQAEEKMMRAGELSGQAEEEAKRADEKSKRAKELSGQVVDQARQVEEKLKQAEARTRQADEKSKEAELKSQQAEEKTKQAQAAKTEIEAQGTGLLARDAAEEKASEHTFDTKLPMPQAVGIMKAWNKLHPEERIPSGDKITSASLRMSLQPDRAQPSGADKDKQLTATLKLKLKELAAFSEGVDGKKKVAGGDPLLRVQLVP